MNKDAARTLTENRGEHPALAEAVPPPLPANCHTPKDSIVHSCAPPVVGPPVAPIGASDGSRTAISQDPFAIDLRERDSDANRESAGWISSLSLHALLIVFFALLLAPADFGGSGVQQLIVTLSEEDKLEQEASFEVADFSNEIAAEDPEPQLTEPPPVAVPVNSMAPIADSSGAQRGQSVDAGGATGGNAARGSFFGIEAHGHEFVYVLDMSGSMRGRRFTRASDELVRSVGGLREDQNFYVLLFNGSTTQMFGESNLHPTTIAANARNKRELTHWLKKAFKGGSTDPRDALRIALRMDPSAIFMLSDGEFDDQTSRSDAGVLGGDADAFSIVAAASDDIPIHAIAFEDPQSCKNMKRLAEMTRGEYRFTEFQDEAVAKEYLARGRAALRRGDQAAAEDLFHETATTFGSTEAGLNARKEFAALLFASAEDASNNDNLQAAKAALLRIVEIDQDAIVTADIQQQLVDRLLQRSPETLGDERDASVISMLIEVVDRFPHSKTTQQIISPVADGLLEEARQLSAKDELVGSLNKLEEVIRVYPQTVAAKKCSAEQQKITDGLLHRAKELRRTADDVASAKYLRDLVTAFDGTKMEELATLALEELATEMLSRVRDATAQGDRTARADADRELQRGFAGDPILQRVQRDLARRERAARDLLRRANRLERVAQVDRALKQYDGIVKNYSGTLSAKKALDRLQALQHHEPEKPDSRFVGEHAVLIESLLQ